MTRIAMISGPRNISTTMMRAFENRPDMSVFDEPFYGCYLKETGALHPMRDEVMASLPTQWEEVARDLNTAPSDNHTHIFEKHIAFHFTKMAPRDWLEGRKIFLLIRDPRAMVASYNRKYDDVAPIKDSLVFQVALYKKYFANSTKLPVFDARDILKNPGKMMQNLCDALNIPFDDAMLSWPAGRRESDGVWAPHWYDAVEKSTGFNEYTEKTIELEKSLEKIAADCMPDYEYLYERRVGL